MTEGPNGERTVALLLANEGQHLLMPGTVPSASQAITFVFIIILPEWNYVGLHCTVVEMETCEKLSV